MSDNEIDRLFQSKLRNHEVPPSVQGWEKLSNKLKTGKKKGAWQWYAAAATVALMVTVGAIAIKQMRGIKNEQTPLTETMENRPPSPSMNGKSTAITSSRSQAMPNNGGENMDTVADIRKSHTPSLSSPENKGSKKPSNADKKTIRPLPGPIPTGLPNKKQETMYSNDAIAQKKPTTSHIPPAKPDKNNENKNHHLTEKNTQATLRVSQNLTASGSQDATDEGPDLTDGTIKIIYTLRKQPISPEQIFLATGKGDTKNKKRKLHLRGVLSVIKILKKKELGIIHIRHAKNSLVALDTDKKNKQKRYTNASGR